MDRALFFDRIRQSLYDGRMTETQVRGVSTVLDTWEGAPTRFAAYGLATALAEVGRNMQPIKEKGGDAYLTRMYDPTGDRPALAKKNGNTSKGDGIRYAGRGYVQLTWKNNYAKAGRKLGVDLVRYPDRAMEPVLAAAIMRTGMEEGWFTEKKLADYLSGSKTDYRNARRIINGTDRAAEIAGYALAFEAALRAAGWRAAQKPVQTKETKPATPVAPEPSRPEPAKPEPAAKAEKPWWEESPILRQIVNTFSALGIGATTLLSQDKAVIIALAAIIGAVSIFAIYWQAKRRRA